MTGDPYARGLFLAIKERQVSEDKSYIYDMENFFNDEAVLEEISIVQNLFKNRSDIDLEGRDNDHALRRPLTGYRAVHLFYQGERDVVIVYKKHNRDDHVVFYRIGSHDEVYAEDYEEKHKARLRERRRRGDR